MSRLVRHRYADASVSQSTSLRFGNGELNMMRIQDLSIRDGMESGILGKQKFVEKK